ncbi:hypothetical protein FRB99_000803 [Tulasnella sp. 403]|nr:hypothetical protein FRB99_000803 [Tulasnella sp. 403]
MRLSIVVLTVTATVPLLAAPLHENIRNKAGNYMLAKKSVSLVPRKNNPNRDDIRNVLDRIQAQYVPPEAAPDDQAWGEDEPELDEDGEQPEAVNPPQAQGQATRPSNSVQTVPIQPVPPGIDESTWVETSVPKDWTIKFERAALTQFDTFLEDLVAAAHSRGMLTDLPEGGPVDLDTISDFFDNDYLLIHFTFFETMRLSIVVLTVTATVPLLAAPLHQSTRNKAGNYMLAKKSVSFAPRKNNAYPDDSDIFDRLQSQQGHVPPENDQAAWNEGEPGQDVNPPQAQDQAAGPVNQALTVPIERVPEGIRGLAWVETSEPANWTFKFGRAAHNCEPEDGAARNTPELGNLRARLHTFMEDLVAAAHSWGMLTDLPAGRPVDMNSIFDFFDNGFEQMWPQLPAETQSKLHRDVAYLVMATDDYVGS